MNRRIDLLILENADAVAARGADLAADWLRAAVAARGHATFAVSGGQTPWRMLALLAVARVPWDAVYLFQVDERVAPAGHPARNAMGIAAALAGPLAEYPERFCWMPVEDPDLDRGARAYAAMLAALAGEPPELDFVHLGLGADGHCASIFPGMALDETASVAMTEPRLGRRRMTLTMPALNRARRILWLITGRDKRPALAGLLRGDSSIVGSRVRTAGAVVLADREAAPEAVDIDRPAAM
jgi:6-phosphogluconolactonase